MFIDFPLLGTDKDVLKINIIHELRYYWIKSGPEKNSDISIISIDRAFVKKHIFITMLT